MKMSSKKRKMRRKSQRPETSKMLKSIQVLQIHSYAAKGLKIREISRFLGISRNTVKKYLRSKDQEKMDLGHRKRESKLQQYEPIIKALFFSSRGNCEVVRRLLAQEHKLEVAGRTLRRFCRDYRKQLAPRVNAGERYETAPGQQMQIDFGQKVMTIAGEELLVHFFVSVLAYSRRIFVKAYREENQAIWLDGIESAFHYYGGVPLALLSDNSRCIIKEHPRRGKVELTARYEEFCRYWRVRPLASMPYHPQGKGKCERAVRYIKGNALAKDSFSSIAELNEYLLWWCRCYSDERVLHGIFNGAKTPKERFRQEKALLQECRSRTAQLRETTRRVDANGLIRIDNLFYRVPNEVISKDVQILIDDQQISVIYKGREIAKLDKTTSVYKPIEQKLKIEVSAVQEHSEYCTNKLQRSMQVYEQAIGGNWSCQVQG